MARKRILRKNSLETVEDRIAAKKNEYAKMIAASKQVSLARAHAEVNRNLSLGLLDKGVAVV